MNRSDLVDAANLLEEAHRSRGHIDALPERSHPSNIEEAHAIQEELIDLLGEEVAGWKVAGTSSTDVMRGAILGSRLRHSPADFPAAMVPLLGVEAEVAFRFVHDFPVRAAPYSRDEVAAGVKAMPAIEVVDSRFTSYSGTPVIDRLCDLMSNGGLAVGEPRDDWRELDYRTINVRLEVGDGVVVKSQGGHRDGDPLLPAVALVNSPSNTRGVRAGQVVTTGTFTGLNYARRGATIRAAFEGLGSVSVHFS